MIPVLFEADLGDREDNWQQREDTSYPSPTAR